MEQYYITPEQYDIAAQNGIQGKTVDYRVRQLLWTIERAITQPTRKPGSIWLAWKDKSVVSQACFYARVKNQGMTPEQAATTPVSEHWRKRTRKHESIPEEYYQQAEKIGVKRDTFYNRIYVYGWSFEKALTTPLVPPGGNRKGWKKRESMD